MKRWIVTLQWFVDKGMYEEHTEAREFEVEAADEQSAREHAAQLVNQLGAHDYEIIEN